MSKMIYAVTHALPDKIIRAGTVIAASATVAILVLAVLSVTHRAQAFAAVQTHFAEPASFYPVVTVASLLLIVALLSALCWAFLRQVRAVLDAARDGTFISLPTARKFSVLAALIVVIELARYPITSIALSVEIAFKGPTSEVAAGAPVAGLIAAIALLATGTAIRTTAMQVNRKGASA